MRPTPAARQNGDAGRTLWLARVLCAASALMPATSAWAAPREQTAVPGNGWKSFARDPQHTALSAVAAQSLEVVRWSTPVDLAPPSGEIPNHLGGPVGPPRKPRDRSGQAGNHRGFKGRSAQRRRRLADLVEPHRLRPTAAQLGAELRSRPDGRQSPLLPRRRRNGLL